MIYHLALPEDWDAAQRSGTYAMSTRGAPLASVGFIHASYQHQVEGVANEFYADVDELMLLTIDPDAVGSSVVDESPTDDPADELFPHIYGPLPVDAVIAGRLWKRQSGQTWRRPPIWAANTADSGPDAAQNAKGTGGRPDRLGPESRPDR